MKRLAICFFLLLLSACNLSDELNSYSKNIDQEKVWVFAEFALTREGDEIASYYYYGKISESLYDGIKHNQIKNGFILLQEVKYWNTEDIIVEYADIENAGEIIFRIEDITRIELVNTPPKAGQGYEQYEEGVSETEQESVASDASISESE